VSSLARLKRRVFYIKIPEDIRNDPEKFLERVSESVKSYGGVLRLKGNSIRVEIYGDGSMIRDSWSRIRQLIREYRSLETEKGLKSYSLKRIFREVGLAIPADVLAEVLKLKGYKTEIDKEYIFSNASFDEIIDVSTDIKKAIEDIRFVQATRTAKKLVATLSVLAGKTVDDIIKDGIETNILVEDNETGKISVISPWREALRELARVIGG